jgi:hypothetical protein
MAELKSNQDNQHGGKREGAGRPKGSSTKPQFGDYISEEKAVNVIDMLYAEALDGKIDAAKWIGDQFFGRATTKLAGDDNGDPLKLIQIIKNGDSND